MFGQHYFLYFTDRLLAKALDMCLQIGTISLFADGKSPKPLMQKYAEIKRSDLEGALIASPSIMLINKLLFYKFHKRDI